MDSIDCWLVAYNTLSLAEFYMEADLITYLFFAPYDLFTDDFVPICDAITAYHIYLRKW